MSTASLTELIRARGHHGLAVMVYATDGTHEGTFVCQGQLGFTGNKNGSVTPSTASSSTKTVAESTRWEAVRRWTSSTSTVRCGRTHPQYLAHSLAHPRGDALHINYNLSSRHAMPLTI